MSYSREEAIRKGILPRQTNHHQHRRAPWHDYSQPCLYMVTLCTEGRLPLFGELAGDLCAPRGSAAFPHIVLSPLGRSILDEELPKIHRFTPEVELWQATIMPDHLHLLLSITSPLPQGKLLGDIISSFKGGCTRAWWSFSQNLSSSSSPSAAVPVPSGTGPRPSLFEPGYHDRIIMRPGMLDSIKLYMADNPLRALIRRAFPRLLERRLHLRIGSHDYAAFGNLFLVKRPEKEQVFFHRKDPQTGRPTETTAAYASSRDRLLNAAREGVVLVSPAVSKGESLLISAAIDEGLPVIHLQKEPITRYWKPERRRFEACARGCLLILSPWGLDDELPPVAEATPSDFARFHRLNDLAEEICATTDAGILGRPE
ncbi:MAG: hypothetical protein K6C30_07165 [Bacteroidaceae bacterium]|nr:hypothetical protein [Bacteroidaceae bacterium]